MQERQEVVRLITNQESNMHNLNIGYFPYKPKRIEFRNTFIPDT